MHQRIVLAALAAAVLGLAGGVGTARADDKAEKAHDHGHFQKCAKACADCMQECDACFHHCANLVADGQKDHAKTMRLCVDCAELCASTGRLCGRDSPLALVASESCAKACDMCAEACEKHPSDDHMKACAKACRDCAKECRKMMEHLGHEHGK